MGDAPAVAILLWCPRDVRTRGGADPSSAPTVQGGAHRAGEWHYCWRRHHSRGDGFVVAAVRQLTDRGFDTVDCIQHSAYRPEFLEDHAVFTEKFAGYRRKVGWVSFSHPHSDRPEHCWKIRRVRRTATSSTMSQCYPAHRDVGVAKLLVAAAFAHAAARGFLASRW